MDSIPSNARIPSGGTPRSIRLYDDLLNDFACQRLSPQDFKSRFLEACGGIQNEFSRFVQPDSGRPPTHEWRELRRAVFERDDFTCQYCGVRGGRLQCDHIVPVSHGGSHLLSNLTTACRSCNLSKSNKTLQEWRLGRNL